MKLGYAVNCINPDLPVALSGFAKKRIASSIHDDLKVRVLTFHDQDKITCIIQYDLICIDQTLKNEISQLIMDLPLPKEQLFLFATHTHSGPVGTADNREGILKGLESVFGDFNLEYIQSIAKITAQGIRAALQTETEFELTLANTSLSGIGAERHSLDLPTDTSLFIASFQRTDGKKVLLYNYACHPTIMNGENIEITKDLPYGVEEALKQEYDCICFINGNCGDISTRFTRSESSFDQVLRFGSNLAQTIQEALHNPYYQGPCTTLKTLSKEIVLQVKKVDTLSQASEKLRVQQNKLEALIKQGASSQEQRVQTSFVEGATTNCLLSKILADTKEIKVSISCIQIQDTKSICVPGELFSTLALSWKETPNRHVFGYCNGYILYIADEAAYDAQYYEALSSPLAKGQGEELMKQAIQLANTL